MKIDEKKIVLCALKSDSYDLDKNPSELSGHFQLEVRCEY